MFLPMQTYAYIAFCSYIMGYIFVLYFYLWRYTLNVKTFSCNSADLFSITVHA